LSNALGVLITKNQLRYFASLAGGKVAGVSYPVSLTVALLTLVAIFVIPKITTAIPPSFIALGIAVAATKALNLPLQSISSCAGGVFCSASDSGGLMCGMRAMVPKFVGFLPKVPLNFATLRIVVPPALSVAVGIFIAMITCQIVTRAPKIRAIPETDYDRVLLGQALGNALSGSFGGPGGCSLIPFTSLNMVNGARGALSSLSAAVSLGFLVLLAAPLIGQVPMAALSGLMLAAAINTIKWKPTISAAKLAFSSEGTSLNRVDFFALVFATAVCYKTDITTGVLTGVVITQLFRQYLKYKNN